MIIKGLFRRYERWNPVHPTSGAFWGMGIGTGCGVGWGPGFGPEVIGYVGAGCGIGFCVGFTFAGFGVGLPANWILQIPYNAMVGTRRGAMELIRTNDLFSLNNGGRYGWENVTPHISGLQREASRRFSTLKLKEYLDQKVDLGAAARSIWEDLGTLGHPFFTPNKGGEDQNIKSSHSVKKEE